MQREMQAKGTEYRVGHARLGSFQMMKQEVLTSACRDPVNACRGRLSKMTLWSTEKRLAKPGDAAGRTGRYMKVYPLRVAADRRLPGRVGSPSLV